MTISLESRARGCLIGLAVGDAVGTTVEFQRPGTFAPVEDMVGGGPFGLKAGQWTDDTSMALCLAESLVACDGFDARDQMERYVRWWQEGYWSSTGRCFDIGGTVQSALRTFLQTGEPYSGSSDPYSAGNGSLMRLGPVPLFFAHDPALAVKMSGESSRTTHGAITCIDACRYFGGLIVGACQGADKEALLGEFFTPQPGLWDVDPLCEEIAEIAGGSFKRRQPPEIKGTGYVVRSLEAALWAFYNSSDFREGCLLAVNLGDDADTTAAIYGQIAGAYYGHEAIPASWRQRLAHVDKISDLALRLIRRSKKNS
ncbi:MAG: ADP-ribosylglycohydrolase family protein [Verrucomicrobia bacterium]|nr:ADP-ribosylglycohydrolase family protein [Verrucomicrobiota bacterium]